MKLETWIVDRELLAAREAIAREVVWDPVLAASRVARSIRSDEAEYELARVHVAEVARLLREAALTRCGAPGRSCRAWRRRARRELAQWRVDGFESPGLLRWCASNAIERWPSARELAEAAFATQPSDSARSCIACVERADRCQRNV